MNNKVELGDLVVDTITGFEGIAIGRATYMYGCSRIGIQPRNLKDGEPIEDQWFDDQRVEVKVRNAVPPAPLVVNITQGCRIIDKVTGYTGVITGIAIYHSGNVNGFVQSETLANGKPREALAIPQERLVVVADTKPETSPRSISTTGGPHKEPRRTGAAPV